MSEELKNEEVVKENKIEKWICRIAIALGIGVAAYTIYSFGKDSGYEDGYSVGYKDGNDIEAIKNAYQKGLSEASKIHAQWLYDPTVYAEEGRCISDGIEVSSRIVNNQLDVSTVEDHNKHFGYKNWNARIVFARKPEGYDDIPKFFNEDGEVNEKQAVEDMFAEKEEDNVTEGIEEIVK